MSCLDEPSTPKWRFVICIVRLPLPKCWVIIFTAYIYKWMYINMKLYVLFAKPVYAQEKIRHIYFTSLLLLKWWVISWLHININVCNLKCNCMCCLDKPSTSKIRFVICIAHLPLPEMMSYIFTAYKYKWMYIKMQLYVLFRWTIYLQDNLRHMYCTSLSSP